MQKNPIEAKVAVTQPSWGNILQWIVFASLILYFGRPLFIPLSFAVLISFILYPVCKWMESKGVSKVNAILIGVVMVIFLIAAVFSLLVGQFLAFVSDWGQLQGKFMGAVQDLGKFLEHQWGISREKQEAWIKIAGDQAAGGFLGVIQNILSSGAVSLVLFILIPIYSFLILLYRKRLVEMLQLLFPKEDPAFIHELLHKVIHSYYDFIKGMLIVYMIVGILNSVGLLIIGVPHAILFGFIASILTFIPYVGIMIASLAPITVAWVTTNSLWYPMGVVIVFSVVQYLEANIIFPWAVSQRMKINTLATFIAIIIGGILWGGAGLILFIPFAGIVKLIADHTPSLRALAVFMDDEVHSSTEVDKKKG